MYKCTICNSYIYSEEYCICKQKIRFGKYKNKCLNKIPIPYLIWCYENDAFLPHKRSIHSWIKDTYI